MIKYCRIIKALFLVLTIVWSGQAQNFDPIAIPFEFEGEELLNPLIGGLVAPQFSSFDLDGQGAEDLLVFDRNGGVLLPFINLSTPGNPNYVYAPEYTSFFPDLIKFAQFIDFNNDGKKDIFALSAKAPAIEVWRNTSEGNEHSFELMKFDTGLGDFIPIQSGGDFTNLFVSNIDYPAILDTDNDGDLDILTFDADGGVMYLYTNLVREMGLPEDTLVYKLADPCWGNFLEDGQDETIALSNDRGQCASGLKGGSGTSSERHAGSTVTAFDNDGDGDLDMLLGDVSNRGLVFLENDEINGDAFIIDQDINFPSYDEEANMYIFLASFYIDIDNDGKRDLIVCPNNDLGSDNIDHIWYYNNVGEDNAPIFELVQKDFLHETTLRMGNSSHPCFLDYNEDGLTDLLVGMNHIFSDGNAVSISLYLYENIGTSSQPRFRLVNDDYLDLKDDLSDINGYLAPAAGDLDGDGDTDILISDNRSFLFYFENKAGPGATYQFDNYIYEYKDLRVGSNGKPAIIDLDGDGLSDIIMGERTDNGNPSINEVGGVNFFKNIGSIGNPDFMAEESEFPNTNILGLIYTKTSSDVSGSSAPCFFEGEDGLMVAVGSRSGKIFVYDDIPGNLYGSFNEVYNDLPVLRSGRRSSVAVEDIDNDGYHEIIVGNDSGGLMAFNTTFRTGVVNTVDETTISFKIQPNPANNYIRLNLEGFTNISFSIINMDGRVMLKDQVGKLKNGFDISFLPSGIYGLAVETENGIEVEKFVKY